jgi:4-amino-4-deoxy-L-arabinose transferase-like glycosyltransferase
MLRLLISKRTSLLLATSALLHVLLSLTLELSADEAHYALYALHLDWSYFDHPPLVGWVQWPFLYSGGSDLALRIAPMFCWLLTSVLLMALSDQLFPGYTNHKGARADIVLFSLSPMLHLLGIALVPDTLLMPLTLAVMLATWHLCREDESPRLSVWVLLGILLGLTGLAKYTAFLNAVGVMLVLLHRYGPRLLLRAEPWIAVLVAAIIVSPVFIWNSQHDWMSFHYQLNHAAGSDEWRVGLALRFWCVIWVAFGVALPVLAWIGWRGRHQLQHPSQSNAPPDPIRFSLYFMLPGLLLWLFLSGRGSTLPHWVTPSVMAALPMAAAGAAMLWSHKSRWPQWLSISLTIQTALLAVIITMMLAGGVQTESEADRNSPPGQTKSATNPVADLYGWSSGAKRAMQLAEQEGVQILAVANWTLASRIAWYARPMPVKVLKNKLSQFDLWFGRPLAGEHMIVIDWSQMSRGAPVGPNQFKQCKDLETLQVNHLGRQLSHFHYWLCDDWQGANE